jgi:hypothetical protein
LLFPRDEKNTRGKIVTLLFTNMVIESARSVILENALPIHCIYYTCNHIFACLKPGSGFPT